MQDRLTRNVHLYTLAQSFGGAIPPIIISLGGLVSLSLSVSGALATLPVSMFNLGVALSTLPAALLCKRIGRRPAYLLAAGVGMVSGLISAYGIFTQQFLIFCLGTLMAGFFAANVQSFRFASIEGLSDSLHSTAISRIMIGGLVAAIIGPQMVVWTQDWIADRPYAASFVGQAVLAGAALVILSMIRSQKLQTDLEPTESSTQLRDLLKRPDYCIAVAAGVVSYGLMSFVMTAAPLAMVGSGHAVSDAALGIQWHVLAMFAPSFVTGRLIAWFGKERITAIGLFLIAVSGGVALLGLELMHFWGALILLGVGWNFSFIGATALVAQTYRPEEKALAQGFNDFLIFSMVALGSFMSGLTLNTFGWVWLNLAVFPAIALVLVALLWPRSTARSAQAP